MSVIHIRKSMCQKEKYPRPGPHCTIYDLVTLWWAARICHLSCLPSRHEENALKHAGKKQLTLNGGGEGFTVKVMSGAGWLRTGFFSRPSPLPPIMALDRAQHLHFAECAGTSPLRWQPLACPTGPSQFPLPPFPPDSWSSGVHLCALHSLPCL